MARYEAIEKLPQEKIPQHVAIILDGNGRWAAQQGVPRFKGHMAGADRVKLISDACLDMGIHYMTVYAFSTENWKRSEEEVSFLMSLLKKYLVTNLKDAVARKACLRVIGERSALDPELQGLIEKAEAETACFTRFHLTFAINYGGQDEIVRAARKITAEGMRPEEITAESFAAHLDTAGLPDPDLLIRTSGEERVSNFLLWQLAYAEFYFTPKYWPDFSPEDLEEAVLNYASRNRRFGGRR